ncbi:hypothetical protein SNE35_14705 [Paucibacter sp. R3-3]|uniref:Uncharacterized protein n=1 Tax=Roseateles agri TaxID=3098619 RepID=A0ABU5DKZ0_9BURK|nr:hypothetical protein [Paucibacter sp. R3-3]MDY0745767.1 hypothetical protein [Paucibacter sp. R3-3]
MNRRSLLSLGLVTPWLHGCQSERFVELSWTEDVALHDGSVIVASLRFIYERIGGPFHTDRFSGLILRDTELSFDAGSPSGRMTQLFKRQRPMVLERDATGGWLLVLQGRASFAPGTKQPDWGPDQNGNGQRMARLQHDTFVLAHLRDLPSWSMAPTF